MAGSREPIFLARQTYRHRRLIDAMRFVPVLGFVLFMVPLLGGAGLQRGTAAGGAFVFSVWFGLIAVAALLVRLLAKAPGGVANDPLETDPTPAPSDEAENGRG